MLGRQTVRRMAQELGFSLVDQTKMVTAASELARNALIYGGGGELQWEMLDDGAKRGVRLTFEDQGPGIANIDLAMTDGWTSGNGLGLGLTGARRLVNEFDIAIHGRRGHAGDHHALEMNDASSPASCRVRVRHLARQSEIGECRRDGASVWREACDFDETDVGASASSPRNWPPTSCAMAAAARC